MGCRPWKGVVNLLCAQAATLAYCTVWESRKMTTLAAMLPPSAVAAIFASCGGKATPSAKRICPQANGRKGGQPRKTP